MTAEALKEKKRNYMRQKRKDPAFRQAEAVKRSPFGLDMGKPNYMIVDEACDRFLLSRGMTLDEPLGEGWFVIA